MKQLVKDVDLVVVGGGPAGLSSALMAAEAGVSVVVVERNEHLGGQLIKQTHRFFGSRAFLSGDRGFAIAQKLEQATGEKPGIEVLYGATAFGYYEDGVLGVQKKDQVIYLKPRAMVIATGATEKMLAFPNNDLPGIYGAGAVQTMVNVYGVLPGRRVLMVGAGNIGVIVSYQLMQSGMEVAACIDAAPRIGAYWVHAAKITRLGVPIYTSRTVKYASGKEKLEEVVTWQLDASGAPVPGTEETHQVDVLCLAVGLSPGNELACQAGCAMAYVPELGGQVPLRDENLETTVPNIFVAGDCCGIEEATTAMLEGSLAGVCACAKLGFPHPQAQEVRASLEERLSSLRSGPVAEKIRQGLKRATITRKGA